VAGRTTPAARRFPGGVGLGGSHRRVGDGKVFEKPYGKRVKAPVESMPKAPTQLLDGALASGVKNFDCERAGGVYAALVRNAKMEILAKWGLIFLVICVSDPVVTFHHRNAFQSSPLLGAQKTPSPTVTGWQVYTNKLLGYQFEYPSSWVDNSASYNSQRIAEVASCPVNTCDDVQSFNVQMSKSRYVPDPVPDNWTKGKVSVAGMQADRISTDHGLDDVWVRNNGNWYRLQLFYGTDVSKRQLGDLIFNHILGSFKFINPQPLLTPAEYDLFKNIAAWTLDSGTANLSCNDVCKEQPALYQVLSMRTAGVEKQGENNDVDTPYKAVVQNLAANGWQKCKTLNDEAGTITETYVKNGKLLIVGRHYSMGAGNGLGITITTSNPLPRKSQPVDNPIVSVTSDWKTYTNHEFGFQISYPSDWKVWLAGVDRAGSNKMLTIRLATKQYGGDGFRVMITPLNFHPLTKGSPSDYPIGSNRTEESKSESSLGARCDRGIMIWTNVGSYQYVFTPEFVGLLDNSFQLKDVYQKILSSVRVGIF